MGGKRRNHQPDANMREASEDSSESGGPTNSGNGCTHIGRSFVKSKLSNCFKKSALDARCSVCKKTGLVESAADEGEFSLPPLWICLRCGHQACGREQKSHASDHFDSATNGCHCLAANTQTWDIWCYRCNVEVTGPCRRQLLKIVEISKKKGFLSSPVSQRPIPLPFVRTDVDDENADTSNSPADGPTRVVGLTNLGNTCFFNAVLQCLSQTPFLVKVLEDLQEPGEKFVLPGGKCKNPDDSEEVELPLINGTLDGWGEFTSIFCKTLKTMQNTKTGRIYGPNELLASSRKKTTQCMDGGQHDSHELLRHLLEIVRNEDLRRYQTVILKKLGIGVSIKVNCANNTDKARVKFYGRQASARLLGPEPVFRGLLVSTLKCIECNHSSQRIEPFLDLSLPVMAEKPQPPVLKRKHKGLEGTFDRTGNGSVSIKNRSKKDGKSMEKMKKEFGAGARDRDSDRYGPVSNANGISEEERQTESDADVEDNVSAPEIAESGYSSEKISALTSPVSPNHHRSLKNSIGQCDPDVTTTNINVMSPNPVNVFSTESAKAVRGGNDDNNNSNRESNECATMISFNEAIVATSDSNCAENRAIETASETSEYVEISPSMSLMVNSELSPEGATTSPLSSPVTSKDGLIRPPSGINDEKIEIDRSGTENQNSDWRFLQTVVDEIRLIMENSPGKSELANEETVQHRTDENNKETTITRRSVEKESRINPKNGVNGITVELSKVTVSPSDRSNCYRTKDDDCSIQSCLNQFTALELMNGSNKVGCEACTARENKGKEGSTKMVCTPSTKQYLISRVPAVLILHLKRFQSLKTGFRKVAKHVTFPSLLDLAPVCTDSGKPKVYSLYGVVEHSGTLHGGHYVAYVKARPPLTPQDPRWRFLPSKDSKESVENSSSSNSDSDVDETSANRNVKLLPGYWYHVSDSRVMEVDEATVLRAQAYILFYERIN